MKLNKNIYLCSNNDMSFAGYEQRTQAIIRIHCSNAFLCISKGNVLQDVDKNVLQVKDCRNFVLKKLFHNSIDNLI